MAKKDMKYFTVMREDGKAHGIWFFDGKYVSSVNPNSRIEPIEVGTDKDILGAIKKNKIGAVIKPVCIEDMHLQPFRCFKRMNRPSGCSSYSFSHRSRKTYEQEIAFANGQLISLVSKLREIFQTIHPCAENFNAYGYETRNLLILACTEVESQWKAILAANGLSKDRYTTHDYVKLNKAMRLNEYVVGLKHYPWLPKFQPFKGWGTTGSPTQDLDWYHGYNQTKHDREQYFNVAKLRHVLDAVCACVIMLYSQFGREMPGFNLMTPEKEISSFFEIKKFPEWTKQELYYAAVNVEDETFKEVNYPFV